MCIKLFRLNQSTNDSRRGFLAYFTTLVAGFLLFPVRLKAQPGETHSVPSVGDFAASYAGLVGENSVLESIDIELALPTVAEDGAVVPITLHSKLADIEAFYLFADKNPTPLIAEFWLSPLVAAHISARVKLAESCNVVLLARRGGEFLRCSRWVNVMRGGCGTG